MKKLNFVIFLACLATVLFSQTQGVSSSPNAPRLPLDSAVNNILTQVLLFPQEKIYLQTDKPYYISGEKIFFRAFLLNAFSYQPANMSRYVYVELINAKDSVKIRQQIRPENTLFFGALSLPEDIQQGDYTIRAYTRFMENQGEDYFFIRQIYIADPVKKEKEDKTSKMKTKTKVNQPLKFDVSFYPEGGNLIAGQSSNIAFKSLNSNGNAVEIRGEVFDSQNNQITEFATTHEGMGRFTLNPEFGKQYYALCYQGEQSIKVNLPEVKNNTCALSTVWRQNKLWITVNKPVGMLGQKLYLLIHTGGMVIYSGEWDFSKEVIAMDKNDFPSGVSHLLLLTEDYQPVSERLVFVLNNDWATADIQLPKQKYKLRELVKMAINVPHGIAGQARNDRGESGDSVGRNDKVGSNFAISITDDKDIQPDATSTILSRILLTSELRGYVANPAYYFQPDNRQAEQAADLLMMTHGWNRYDIPKAMRGDYQYLTISNEESQLFSGIVKGGLLSKPYANSKVTIISPNTSFYDIAETDEKGRFIFKDFEFPDSTSYIIQALNKKGKDIVELYLDSFPYPTVSSTKIYLEKQTEEIAKLEFKKYVEKADLKYTYENGMRMRTLPELVVKGRDRSKHQSPYYTMPDESFSEDDIRRASDMRSLFRKGVDVRLRGEVLRVRYIHDSSGPPMIMIDGQKMVYGGDDDINDDEVWNILDHLDIEDVVQVDVISSPAKRLVYGLSYGQNGVIEIFTKHGYWNTRKPRFNTQKITPLGYQQPLEFYSPQYDTPEARNRSIPDLRSTIYWKPDVLVDSDGKASVDFYTADSPSTYSVIIEGITPEGKLIYQREEAAVVVE